MRGLRREPAILDGTLGLAASAPVAYILEVARRASVAGLSRATHGANPPAVPAAAEEAILAVGLESRDLDAITHLEPLEPIVALRSDAPQLALVALPGAGPQLAFDPGDTGDESVRVERSERRPRARIDRVNLSRPILP